MADGTFFTGKIESAAWTIERLKRELRQERQRQIDFLY